MGQGERIEISNPCPQTPSIKRSLNPHGIKKSLNLQFRPNPILVAVSLTLILMVSGLVILWILIRDMFFQNDMYYGQYDWDFFYVGMGWSGISLLAGFMIIKERLNLHFRSNPILVGNWERDILAYMYPLVRYHIAGRIYDLRLRCCWPD
jgi:hypothetical protein